MRAFIIIVIAACVIGIAITGVAQDPSKGLITAVVLIPLLALNFLPTIIASNRHHAQTVLLGVLNFIASVFPLPFVIVGSVSFAVLIIFGWWIALLIWACCGKTDEDRKLERAERAALIALLQKQTAA